MSDTSDSRNISKSGRDRAALTPTQFALVREAFRKALEAAPAQYAEVVGAASAGDELVREHVMELLNADAAAAVPVNADGGGLVQRLLAGEAGRIAAGGSDEDEAGTSGTARGGTVGLSDRVPEYLGRYRVQRMLGKGGMGVVYLASQTNPDREVAVKVLRSDSGARGSRGLRGRFAREIRALGRLEHPGIARIYDAGVEQAAGEEISYFAMEYVRGPELTAYAAQEKLSPAERAGLMAKVADAVQHAHTRGVLHRDLKPSNVLVRSEESPTTGGGQTGEMSEARSRGTATGAEGGPQPKILDFGVARVFEPDTQHTVLTHHGLLIGTVAYMSPEQLGGAPDAVDTRADIYAMGVMLYELVTGVLPFDVAGKPLAEAAKLISEGEARPMRARSPDESGKQTRVDRDLVTITSKAMARDKERRYSSASELAEDLRRYLRDDPIMARSPTAAYQFSKFARRNRGLVAMAGTVVAAVVAGLVISSVLYLREQKASAAARREASLSTAVREYLMKDILQAASPSRMGYEVKMLDALDRATDGLEARFKGHPDVEAEVRMFLSTTFDSLGKFKESYHQAGTSLTLFEKTLGRDAPEMIETLNAMTQAARGMQNHELALGHAQDSVGRASRALAADAPLLARAYNQLGGCLVALGRQAEAIAELNKAIGIFKAGGAELESELLTAMSWLQVALRDTGDHAGSLQLCRQVLLKLEKLQGSEHPDALAARNNLVAALRTQGLFAEAADSAEQLPAAAMKAFPPGHPGRGYSHLTAMTAMREAGRMELAERYGLDAYRLLVESFDDLNWVTERSVQLLRALYAGWPGHATELERWQFAAVRVRFMVANADERPTTLKLLTELAAERVKAGETGEGTTAVGLVPIVWARAEELAPPGHERRALFFANLALVAAEFGNAEVQNAALVKATEALAYAKDRTTAEAIMAAVAGGGDKAEK